MKYFGNVENIEQLRKRYRELLKKYHPDNGGDEDVMKQINAEYDRLSKAYFKEKQPDRENSDYDYEAENEAFKEVLNKIIHINADIEIIGSWIWVHGGYEYRELLKNCGFKFGHKKKAWTWHYGEYKRYSKKDISLEEIRQKYGNKTVNSKSKQFAIS